MNVINIENTDTVVVKLKSLLPKDMINRTVSQLKEKLHTDNIVVIGPDADILIVKNSVDVDPRDIKLDIELFGPEETDNKQILKG